MVKNELLEKFVKGLLCGDVKGSNLEVLRGKKLINYTTPIAINHNGIIYLNNKKYSQTTTVNQNKIRNYCTSNNVELIEISSEEILKMYWEI